MHDSIYIYNLKVPEIFVNESASRGFQKLYQNWYVISCCLTNKTSVRYCIFILVFNGVNETDINPDDNNQPLVETSP